MPKDYIDKTKREEEPIFRTRPPPFLDAKINSSCYPVEADWAHLNKDPMMPEYLKMHELNVKIRRQEKNAFIAAKGKGWKIQAQGTSASTAQYVLNMKARTGCEYIIKSIIVQKTIGFEHL